MADVQKPVAAEPVAPVEPAAAPAVTETPAAEPTIPAATSAEPGVEAAKVEEPAKDAEETKEAAPVKEEPKPSYEGALQYNGGSGVKSLIGLKEKFFFYFGDEAVPTEKLAHLIKPTKDALKETVAWSSQTGKGLLYYVKHPDQKTSPKGVIGLADVEEPKSVGFNEITFKANGHKHNLVAETKAARDGWLLALKEKIEEAKALKEEITAKDGFKEAVEKLTSKPAAVVAGAAAKTSEAVPKKSTDSKAERSARSEVADSKKSATKDRSQSRGKRLLDTIRGKKEGDAVKTEEAKAEEVPATEPVVAAATTEAAAETTEPAVPVVSTEEKETKPAEVVKDNKARRGSKFFDRIKGAVSPTTEKKEHEVVPAAEVIDAPADVAPVLPLTETSKEVEATPEVAAPAAEATPADAEAKVEEPVSPTTAPKDEKRRSSFFGLGSLRKPSEKKVKEETKPAEEPVKAEEVAPEPEAAKPEEVAAPAPVEAETPAVAAIDKDVKTPAKTEKKENAFAGLKRSLSKALHGGEKPKKEKSKPAEKVEEVKEDTEKAVEPETEAVKAPETKEPAAIGDVVPEAVTIGTAPPASATVQATA